MGIPLTELHGTPFTDFTIPALLLGIVVGGSTLAATMVTVWGPPWSWPLVSAAAGCIMVGWMTIEIALIGLDVWVQALYFAVGLLMIALAGLLQRAESRHADVSSRMHAHVA
jgi:hypothetical protein